MNKIKVSNDVERAKPSKKERLRRKAALSENIATIRKLKDVVENMTEIEKIKFILDK